MDPTFAANMAAFGATPDFVRIMAGVVQGALAAQAAPASAPPANQRRGKPSATISTLGGTSGTVASIARRARGGSLVT